MAKHTHKIHVLMVYFIYLRVFLVVFNGQWNYKKISSPIDRSYGYATMMANMIKVLRSKGCYPQDFFSLRIFVDLDFVLIVDCLFSQDC